MEILFLVILFILSFITIKNTPYSLSRAAWHKHLKKQLENNKNSVEITDAMKGGAILILFAIELFLIIFYTLLGNKIGTTKFIVLSALQVVTCFWNISTNFSDFKTVFSYNIEDHKFHRFQLLFNLILDYIYYPLAIYALLSK